MSSDTVTHDLIPNHTDRQHIVLCSPFVTSSNYFNGFENETEVEITPEVITIRDEEGKVVTSQIIFHLNPGYKDGTGNIVTEIPLGSFGQSDLLRLWMTGESATNIFDMSGYLDSRLQVAKKRSNGVRRLDLDDVLYKCLNVGFFGHPSKYDKENMYSAVQWKELPPELLSEIERRVDAGEPLNYVFLAYAIMHEVAANLSISNHTEVILERARDEIERSNQYTRKALNGFNEEEGNMLAEMHECLYELDFNVELNGTALIDPLEIYPAFLAELTTPLGQLVSGDSRINLAGTLISELCLIVHNNISLGKDFDAMIRLPLILDRVREVMTKRIYEKLSEKGFMDNMTLGEFAAEICTLRMNNNDPNLASFIGNRNEAPSLLKAYSRNRRFEG